MLLRPCCNSRCHMGLPSLFLRFVLRRHFFNPDTDAADLLAIDSMKRRELSMDRLANAPNLRGARAFDLSCFLSMCQRPAAALASAGASMHPSQIDLTRRSNVSWVVVSLLWNEMVLVVSNAVASKDPGGGRQIRRGGHSCGRKGLARALEIDAAMRTILVF